MRRMIPTKKIDILNKMNIANDGNLKIASNIDVNGKITGNEIVENMTGYSASVGDDSVNEFNPIYVSVCKNGNKITFVVFGEFTKLSTTLASPTLVNFVVPDNVYNKLYPSNFGGYQRLYVGELSFVLDQSTSVKAYLNILKATGNKISFDVRDLSNLVQDTKYMVRAEATFLLNDSLIS